MALSTDKAARRERVRRSRRRFSEQGSIPTAVTPTLLRAGDVVDGVRLWSGRQRSMAAWTLAGPVVLVLLFDGSVRFGESISKSKYPSYAVTNEVSRLIPWAPKSREILPRRDTLWEDLLKLHRFAHLSGELKATREERSLAAELVSFTSATKSSPVDAIVTSGDG